MHFMNIEVRHTKLICVGSADSAEHTSGHMNYVLRILSL